MHPLVDHLIEAAVESGYRLNDDFNGALQLGVGRFQLAQRSGVRCSAASAYFHPARERPNLQVFTDTLVLQLLLEGHRATGVSIHRHGRTDTFSPKEKSYLRQAPMAHLKSSCCQALGPPTNWARLVFLWSSIFRSEQTFRITLYCR